MSESEGLNRRESVFFESYNLANTVKYLFLVQDLACCRLQELYYHEMHIIRAAANHHFHYRLMW